MSQKDFYSYYNPVIANGNTLTVYTNANYIRILSSTGGDIKLRINDQPEQPLPAGLGLDLPAGNEAIKLDFRNDTGESLTLVFALANGYIDDARNVISGVVITNSAGNGLESPASVTVTTTAQQLITADADVREVTIQNNGANNIWIGDANVDGANNRGFKIGAGESYILSASAGVYLRTTVGTSIASILKVTRS